MDMATVHAGVKRSFKQMQDVRFDTHPHPASLASPNAPRSGASTPQTRSQSPYRQSHPPAQNPILPRKVSFRANASIVLIGLSGTGKSSLAVLAATAYNRRLIEFERAFAEATGVTAQTYRKQHGLAAFYETHDRVLRETLHANGENAVVVCSFSDAERSAASVLVEYAQSHPVIHVSRDAAGMQSYFNALSLDRLERLMLASAQLLRFCTNFSYHNLSEELSEPKRKAADVIPGSKARHTSGGPFLTLKRVERDFLKFLRNILGDHERIPSHHSAYPLSQIPVHERSFSLCAIVHMDQVLDPNCDLDALQIGADALELLIDGGESSSPSALQDQARAFENAARAFAKLRRSTILPIILTPIKTSAEWVNYCLRLAPEYCTVDLTLLQTDLEAIIEGKGRTKIIGSRSMTQRLPLGWHDPSCLDIHKRAQSIGCDVVKITMPAESHDDNLAVLNFREAVKSLPRCITTVAYNTGRRGRMSKCFGASMTPVVPAGVHLQDWDDGGHVHVKDVIGALFATFTYEPLRFFIYGASVDYSLSPAMSHAAYDALGFEHSFTTYSLPTLDAFRTMSRQEDFGGAAIVQPFKTEVIPMLAGMSLHAKAIGSVNTIIPVRNLLPDGAIPIEADLLSGANIRGPVRALYGYNTDWIGMRACLRRGLSPANTVRPHSTGLVCGAGGQARAAVYALLSLGVRNIFICNRTREHAQKLADHYNRLIDSNHEMKELGASLPSNAHIHVIPSFDSPWPPGFRRPTLIVSSVPTQNTDGTAIEFSIPESWLQSPTGGVLIELAYHPMLTAIVKQMRRHASRGWIFMDGFDILPEQAYAQFELFTGRRAPRKIMQDEVVKAYEKSQGEMPASAALSLDMETPVT